MDIYIALDDTSESWRYVARARSSDGRVQHEIRKHGGVEVLAELFREMAAWVEMAVGQAPDYYWLRQYPKGSIKAVNTRIDNVLLADRK